MKLITIDEFIIILQSKEYIFLPLKNNKNLDQNFLNKIPAALVDVRTPGEWKYGIPVIEDSIVHFIDIRDKEFASKLEFNIPNKNTLVFFICRAGVRSIQAALSSSEIGYINCYNIKDGFEGNGSANGWKYSKLAWQIP